MLDQYLDFKGVPPHGEAFGRDALFDLFFSGKVGATEFIQECLKHSK